MRLLQFKLHQSFYSLLATFLWASLALFSACSSLDKTDIRPGDRVEGPGISFTVPTNASWFAVDYGTSNHVKISQLNYDDSYAIEAFLNRGPRSGMYKTRKQHLEVLKRYKSTERDPEGYTRLSHREWIESEDPRLCVRYTSSAEDWRGRNNEGPALIELYGMVCAHPLMKNALLTIEVSRRFEDDSTPVDVSEYASTVFRSLEFKPL